MCYICQNINEDKEIYSDGKDRWYMKRLSNGHWYLFHKNVNVMGIRGIKIQNCPMCGRALGEGAKP